MDRFGRERARREFEEFVTANAQHLLRTAYLICWDRADAEDLVQECLLRVARRWPRVRRMERPAAYARRIVVNLAVDRAAGRALGTTERDAAAERADDAAARELHAVDVRAELLAMLATLPARQRAMLVLRYFEDLSEEQVAKVLRCSVGTVKSTTSRALAQLRAQHQAPISPTEPRAAAVHQPRIQGVQSDA